MASRNAAIIAAAIAPDAKSPKIHRSLHQHLTMLVQNQ
jgi:hypothetical protein